MSGNTLMSSNRAALADLESEEIARWERAARQYTGPLRGFFIKRVRNPADVDDLVQEVFVQLIQRARNKSNGEAVQHLEQYIFQAAANVLRDRGRRDQVRHRDAHESFEESEHGFANEITPERIVLGEEGIAHVNAVLRELPECTRDVFVLRWINKHTFPEIARKLGMTKRHAQRHMAAALKHLGRVLG
jgi:RNA polymerase sigma-70 factor (ECF subfamily)